MATLESQYKTFLAEHPQSNFTFDEWEANVLGPMISEMVKQINELEKTKLKERNKE